MLEKLFKFTCLPNGLCSGPRKFTKLLKPPLAEQRLDSVQIAAYIDDLITLASTFDICFKNVWKCVKRLSNLPSQEIKYFGFVINSNTMTVTLTTEKKRKIFDLCQEVLLKESVSIRVVSKQLGKFTSSFQAVKYGQLHYFDLENLKTKALKINKSNFDKKISIDPHGKQHIIW